MPLSGTYDDNLGIRFNYRKLFVANSFNRATCACREASLVAKVVLLSSMEKSSSIEFRNRIEQC